MHAQLLPTATFMGLCCSQTVRAYIATIGTRAVYCNSAIETVLHFERVSAISAGDNNDGDVAQ